MPALMKSAIAVMAGSLILGVAPAAWGGSASGAMSTAQARRVFLKTVCPLNQSLLALDKAENSPGVKWADLQPLVKSAGNLQVRTARKLSDPVRPWPKGVRQQMPALVAMDYTQAGASYVLASASSMKMYKALSKTVGEDASPTLKKQVRAFVVARASIHAQLGLPDGDACEAS